LSDAVGVSGVREGSGQFTRRPQQRPADAGTPYTVSLG
jgi:hypothetical protein